MKKAKLFLFLTGLILILSEVASAQQQKWIRIENRREVFPIWFVYLTPAGDRSWGKDQLNGEIISAGSSMKWNIPWDGCYIDARAETFTGLAVEAKVINVCGGYIWTISDR